MIKINLLPPHIHQRKQVKVATGIVVVMLAGEIARNKKQRFPQHVNPFTGIDEGAEYDALFAAQEKKMNVLYINSLTCELQVQEDLVQTMPDMDKWIWIDRSKGRDFPYEDLGLHVLSIRSGTIMKQDEKRELREYVKHNNIDIIILNSFEFACRTQREKDDMVDLLKFFRDEYCVSILIFTHESVKRFAPGASRRGPMGALSILADWASSIDVMAPELDAELNAPIVCGSTPEARFEGFDGDKNVYRHSEEVVTMLREAPDSMLPREHVREDGTLTKERFDHRMNSDKASVVKIL